MFRDKLKQMGMFPDVSKLTDMFDQKFAQLLGELQAMHGVLDAILAELRKGTPQ